MLTGSDNTKKKGIEVIQTVLLAKQIEDKALFKEREKANKLVEALELLTNEEPERDKANAIIKQSLTEYEKL